MSDQLAELLREAIRAEQTTVEALTAFDAFTDRVPATLTSAWGYLEGAREHAFTCLDPDLRRRPARLGGPELGTGVLERLMFSNPFPRLDDDRHARRTHGVLGSTGVSHGERSDRERGDPSVECASGCG